MELIDLSNKDINKWTEIYEQSFPEHERFELNYLLQLKEQRDDVKLLSITQDQEIIGMLVIREITDKKAFIFYFALDSSLRGQGLGTKVLEMLKKKYLDGFVLESEAVYDGAAHIEMRKRRLGFYARNGLIETGYLSNNMDDTYEILVSTPNVTIQEYTDSVHVFEIEMEVHQKP